MISPKRNRYRQIRYLAPPRIGVIQALLVWEQVAQVPAINHALHILYHQMVYLFSGQTSSYRIAERVAWCRHPIFLTFLHMVACTVMSLMLSCAPAVDYQLVKSRKQFFKIAGLSIFFCAAVVLGNVSLKYIPVSFNQAIGATTPFFTAIVAFILQGQRESWTTYGALVPVVLGVVMATGFEPNFELYGFIACVTAAATRALKTVVQSMLLSDGEKMSSMSLLLYMAPMAATILIPAVLIMEPTALGQLQKNMQKDMKFILLLALNGCVAYLVNLTNFLVTKHTSALTLQVLGNAKGIVAAGISILVFRNQVTLYGMIGYAITVAGVVLYSEAKKRSKVKYNGSTDNLLQPKEAFQTSRI